MGQFIILHGEATSRAALASRVEVVASVVTGHDPVARIETETFTVRTYPSLARIAVGMVTPDGSRGAWACGAGAWLHRDLDSENVLHRLASMPITEGVPAVIDELEGSFVLAAGDEDSGTLRVYTDLVGTLHAYVVEIGSVLVISTSSMILAGLAPRSWDLDSLREFLATGTVFGQRTLFHDIAKLPPCSEFRRERDGARRVTRYWEFERHAFGARAGASTVEDLAASLVESASLILDRVPDPVVDLTGGYDSRAVLGAILKCTNEVDTVVNGDAGHPDVRTANAIANRYGLRHRHNRLPDDWDDRWWGMAVDAVALCDGEYDVLEYGRVLHNHMRLAGEFGGSVNGSGGEFCKGYWWELLLPYLGSRERFDSRRLSGARFILDDWADQMLAHRFDMPHAERFAQTVDDVISGLDGHRNTAKLDYIYLVVRMQRWQGRIASATNRVWPCLSPFMFRKPMEAAFGASIAMRYGNRLSGNLIETLDPALAAMPLAQGYPALPIRPTTLHRFGPLFSEVAGKVWRRFVPGARGRSVTAPDGPDSRWVRLLDRDEVRDLRDPARMQTRDLYEDGATDRLFEDARGGGGLATARAGRVLTLEMMVRQLTRARSEASRA